MSMSSVDFHPARTHNPYHIGLIPDGTRRWSQREGLSLYEGYNHASKNLIAWLTFLYNQSTNVISISLSSVQNFRRTSSEIHSFCKVQAEACNNQLPLLVERYQLKVSIAGNISLVPEYLQQALLALQSNCYNNSARKLYLGVAYDPFDEIEYAFRHRPAGHCLSKFLWVPEPIDLVIRTGGANLISSFLPLQTGYARLYFLKKLFNDVTVNEIACILKTFGSNIRHYGE